MAKWMFTFGSLSKSLVEDTYSRQSDLSKEFPNQKNECVDKKWKIPIVLPTS